MSMQPAALLLPLALRRCASAAGPLSRIAGRPRPVSGSSCGGDGGGSFDGAIPMDQVRVSHVTSSSPGGQHANKTATKVEIRLHLGSVSFIPEPVKAQIRLMQAGRINKEDWLIVTSERTRRQVLNQADCLDKIRDFVRQAEAALVPPLPLSQEAAAALSRRRERAIERRLGEKRGRSADKSMRKSGGNCSPDDW